MTDAVAVQLITTLGTIVTSVTVVITGYLNRRRTDEKGDELHRRFDSLAQRDSGAHSLAEFQAMAAADLRRRDRPRHTPLSTEMQPGPDDPH